MIAIAALGMGALLKTSEFAFTVVKLLGAAYLVWKGIKILCSKIEHPSETPELGKNGVQDLVRKESFVAVGNPKAILIFTAFFPQFVESGDYWFSFLILGAIFLVQELVAVALYAYAGRANFSIGSKWEGTALD